MNSLCCELLEYASTTNKVSLEQKRLVCWQQASLSLAYCLSNLEQRANVI